MKINYFLQAIPKFWPLIMPRAHKSTRIAKISILKLEGIIKNVSYERCDYESVGRRKEPIYRLFHDKTSKKKKFRQ